MLLVLEIRWDDVDETCCTHAANTFETDVGKRPRVDGWIILTRMVKKYPTRGVPTIGSRDWTVISGGFS
jgi:hypothetical protein